MSTAIKQRMPLVTARVLAERIVDELRPFCERIEIAGSIRRRRPLCGDVDLVALPKDGRGADLEKRIMRHCKSLSCGDQNIYVLMANGVE